MTNQEKNALYSVLLQLIDDGTELTPLERRDLLNTVTHACCGMTADDILSATENNRKLRIKRGTTAQNDAYTGLSGEITLDTETNTLRVHDGETQGGHVVTGGASGTTLPAPIMNMCCVPDYNNISANVGNNYTAPCPGVYWFACPNSNSQRTIYINEYGFINVLNSYGARGGYQIMLDTDDTICIDNPNQTLDYSYFIPFKTTEIL